MYIATAPPLAAGLGARPVDTTVRMRLRYGVNIGDRWRDVVFGSADAVFARLQDAGTELVRVFVDDFDRPVADGWPACSRLLDWLLRSGATPMIAIAQPSAGRDRQVVRDFAGRCGEFIDRCCELWGTETVAAWYWSIGDEPNSPWTNEGLTFEGFKDIYEVVAQTIHERLGRAGRRVRTGGPCIDGFQPFWFEWAWRFIDEIDPSMIAFVAWNRYGDWREVGTWSAPTDPGVFSRLLLSRTAEYWSRCEALRTVLAGKDILNICSELNAHSHSEAAISARFNQTMFGAVYYASALIELMRGGADGEFLWAGACAHGPYAAVTDTGDTTPTYQAKRLIAQHVRFGSRLAFPLDSDPDSAWDALVARDDAGDRAAVLIHRACAPGSIELGRWPELTGFSEAISPTRDGSDVIHAECREIVAMDGYGLAILR